MAKLHFDEIDIVKGIAILFVLWHHSFIKFPIYMLDIPWCKYAMAIHGTFYLNVFFLVSGYLFAHSKPRTFTENFKKKASSNSSLKFEIKAKQFYAASQRVL